MGGGDVAEYTPGRSLATLDRGSNGRSWVSGIAAGKVATRDGLNGFCI